MRKLIVEMSMPPSSVAVVEETAPSDGPKPQGIGFTAKLSEVDFLNRNKRIYPRAEMEIAVEAFNRKLREPELYGYSEPGLVNHPLMQKSLADIGVKWEHLWFEGNHLMGKGRTVGTQRGRDLEALMLAGIPVGFSSRANAETEDIRTPDGVTASRMKNIELITFDAVVDPSVNTARVRALHEETEDTEENRAETAASVTAEEQHKHKEEEMQLEELIKQVSALQEAAARREQELAQLNAKVAVMEEETRRTALMNRLRELTEGHRFAATIINEAVSMGVTFEQAEQVVNRLKALTEAIASASASGLPSGRGATEEPEVAAEEAAPVSDVASILEGTGLL